MGSQEQKRDKNKLKKQKTAGTKQSIHAYYTRAIQSYIRTLYKIEIHKNHLPI